jgi:hypothetical protein
MLREDSDPNLKQDSDQKFLFMDPRIRIRKKHHRSVTLLSLFNRKKFKEFEGTYRSFQRDQIANCFESGTDRIRKFFSGRISMDLKGTVDTKPE